jgi:murein DD-endopeptidase MepM/ murein hydrolase activator NlpD
MRTSPWRTPLLRAFSLAVLTMMVSSVSFVLPGGVPSAHAAKPGCNAGGGKPEDERRLKKASAARQQVQKDLNKLLNTGEVLKARIEETDAEHTQLVKRQRKFDKEAGKAHSELASRVRRSYMLRNADPVLTMLSATDAEGVVEQSRVLGMLAEGSRAHVERASSAAQRNQAAAEQADLIAGQLDQMQQDYGKIKDRTRGLLDKAKQQEARLSAKVALQRAANGSGCPLPAGAVSGGLACPVDQPRSYTDTWGAARSGGRAHLGVDILAPIGTPLRAYENGTITRMNSNSLGGISLYLRGNSGNEYYYTHMSGYVSGLSTGQRVTAGQHIAFVGDTGNAAGIPHLHWEVRPGGGGAVNPYPYAHSVCG